VDTASATGPGEDHAGQSIDKQRDADRLLAKPSSHEQFDHRSDDGRRRVAYSVVEWRATHHNASIQVFAEGPARSRVVWIADLLPNDLAELVDGLMAQGCVAMKRTLEAAPVQTHSGL